MFYFEKPSYITSSFSNYSANCTKLYGPQEIVNIVRYHIMFLNMLDFPFFPPHQTLHHQNHSVNVMISLSLFLQKPQVIWSIGGTR